jgi:glycosyltransferase involved in cell wall biosynthesis
MRTSLVIATYNRKNTLINLLPILEKLDPYKIVIVDDNSADNTKNSLEELIHNYSVKMKYIFLKEKSGVPIVKNTGIRHAGGDLIGFFDDDCIPLNKNCLRIVEKWFNRDDIVGVGGPVYLRSTEPIPDRIEDKVARIDYNKPEIYGYHNTIISKSLYVDHLPGGNSFYRKNELLRINGLDPCFNGNFYREETDLCMRIKGDKKIVYDPKIPVNHLRVPSGGCRVSPDDWYMYKMSNTMLLILKNWGRKKYATVSKYITNNAIDIIKNKEDKRYYHLNRSKLWSAYFKAFKRTLRKIFKPHTYNIEPDYEVTKNY